MSRWYGFDTRETLRLYGFDTREALRWYGFGPSWGVWSDWATSWDVGGCVTIFKKDRMVGFLVRSWYDFGPSWEVVSWWPPSWDVIIPWPGYPHKPYLLGGADLERAMFFLDKKNNGVTRWFLPQGLSLLLSLSQNAREAFRDLANEVVGHPFDPHIILYKIL